MITSNFYNCFSNESFSLIKSILNLIYHTHSRHRKFCRMDESLLKHTGYSGDYPLKRWRKCLDVAVKIIEDILIGKWG